jgi:hypothetical protein
MGFKGHADTKKLVNFVIGNFLSISFFSISLRNQMYLIKLSEKLGD